MGVNRYDDKKQKLKFSKKTLYERWFLHKFFLKDLSMGVQNFIQIYNSKNIQYQFQGMLSISFT